jgi:hypothetical protein
LKATKKAEITYCQGRKDCFSETTSFSRKKTRRRKSSTVYPSSNLKANLKLSSANKKEILPISLSKERSLNITETKGINARIKTEKSGSKFGSDLSVLESNKRDNSMMSSHDIKLSYLNEISPLTSLPKNYTKRLHVESSEMQLIFKSICHLII